MLVAGAGGLIGVLVGVAAGFGAVLLFGMPVIFIGLAIGGAVCCAALTGIVFGFWPT